MKVSWLKSANAATQFQSPPRLLVPCHKQRAARHTILLWFHMKMAANVNFMTKGTHKQLLIKNAFNVLIGTDP